MQHARGHASVTAHRIEAARAKGLLHARAGVTGSRDFKHGRANLQNQRPVLEQAAGSKQIEPGDNKVASQITRIHHSTTGQSCDHGKMLSLDQCDLASASSWPAGWGKRRTTPIKPAS